MTFFSLIPRPTPAAVLMPFDAKKKKKKLPRVIFKKQLKKKKKGNR